MEFEKSNTLEHSASHESDEVAYLLLEECSIFMSGEPEIVLKVPSATWIDVSRGTDKKVWGESSTSPCERGELILHASSSGIALASDLAFDGTIGDSCHSGGCCSLKSNRSDAALMVGLALTCESIGQIRILSFQIILRSLEGKDNGEHEESAIRAALLITFSIPTLHKLNERSNTKSKRVFKALPPSVQLLYTILRSDWDHMEKEMFRLRNPIRVDDKLSYQIRSDGTVLQERISLFPAKLSLQELYVRIRGTSNHSFLHRKVSLELESPLTSVPEDVLVTHIAPFLRAKALDSLRCSCSQLHESLQAVVPGMKLRLFKHQISSLCCMRRREILELSEEKCLAQTYSNLFQGGDMHRALSGGATVCLQSRKNRKVRYRIDQQYGKPCPTNPMGSQGASNFFLTRKAARGGLLCDEPGLGKSVTVLSLILQTFGVQSKPDREETLLNNAECFNDEQIFFAYWKEAFSPIYQRPALNKILKSVARTHPLSYRFHYPIDPIENEAPDYFDVITNPICFKDIISRINADFYIVDFILFEADLRLCFENAIMYNPEDNEIHLAAKELLLNCNEILCSFKRDQVRSAKKSFSSASAKPNSSIAAILEKRAKAEQLDSLLSSKATLLVVPGNLLNHWEEQIMMHVDLPYCTNGKEPLIFHYYGSDSRTQKDIRSTLTKCMENGTHFPLIFIDKSGTKKLPHERFLSLFSIVITTTQRLSSEWKNGSFADERKQEDGRFNAPHLIKSPSTQSCSLLKIHWTRLIVDEGHAMGRGKQNNAILFASWISAQRRWVMTGTPTPQTVAHSGLVNMNALLHFLQHDFFGSRLSGDQIWRNAIVRSWNDGNVASFFRLQALLSALMMRHTKLDIEELSPPRYRKTHAPLSLQETKTYNTIVCAIQSNLLLTSMNGKTKGLQDSLLHRSQSKHAKMALHNMRLACTGGTRVIPTLTKQNFDETIDLLISHNVDPVSIKLVENYLHRAVAEELTSCMSCGIQLNTMLVMTCGHLVCSECVTTEMQTCPVCEVPFNIDDFQLLQPGMNYEWAWNLENINKRKTADPMPIDVLPPIANGGLGLVIGNDSSAAAGHVPMRPGVLPTRRRNLPNDGHKCEYDPTATHGRCLLCLEEHDECVMLSENSQCPRCHRNAQVCPEEESKFFYLIDKLQTLLKDQVRQTKIASETVKSLIGEETVLNEARRLKVIVFSQFRQSLNVAGDRLLRRFGAGCVAEYWGRFRSKELIKFFKSNDCFCMLLGKDGSEGLDLSFVTHIFFLEEVWDKSLESQAVARAWRMGASGHVEVETLIAKDSVESMMAELEKILSLNYGVSSIIDNENGGEDSLLLASAKEFQWTKQNFLLKNAKLIKPRFGLRDTKLATKRKVIENVENTKSTRVRFNLEYRQSL